MKQLIALLIVVGIVLVSCGSLKSQACSSEFDFSLAKISNSQTQSENIYLSKNQHNLLYSKVVPNGGGQIEVIINTDEKVIQENIYANGDKQTKTLSHREDYYDTILKTIDNEVDSYLDEAQTVEGYDPQYLVEVETYSNCLKKLI